MSNDFFRKYDMSVYPSNRKMRRIPRMRDYTNLWNVTATDALAHQSFEVEDVNCVDITMPVDRLRELEAILEWYANRETKIQHNSEVVEMLRRDERVRIEYPVVQAAYKKYLNLLELCRK